MQKEREIHRRKVRAIRDVLESLHAEEVDRLQRVSCSMGWGVVMMVYDVLDFHAGTFTLEGLCKISNGKNMIILIDLTFLKTVLSSGYILILLSIEYILASLIEMCQG